MPLRLRGRRLSRNTAAHLQVVARLWQGALLRYDSFVDLLSNTKTERATKGQGAIAMSPFHIHDDVRSEQNRVHYVCNRFPPPALVIPFHSRKQGAVTVRHVRQSAPLGVVYAASKRPSLFLPATSDRARVTPNLRPSLEG